uniref:hypothetical protein n=1 Tax=Pedobacter schmidteae TaxID=2201271 RepID=UPI001D009660|nr:hypothetical protein [Pedobacter schmidteae]
MIWQNSVLLVLQELGIEVVPFTQDKYDLLRCNDRVVLNLIPLGNDYRAEDLIELQNIYQFKGITLIQLWEDVWHSRTAQVLGRIKSVLGLNERLHGRKGIIRPIDQQQADDFLQGNHIQGSAKARYKFGLHINGQLVAVACFSNVRYMKKVAEGHRSVELIRFATLIGFTVTGGFTRLLKHLIKTIKPDDVMSYADRDWSLGNAYVQSGFKLVEVTPPAHIWVRKEDMIRFFPHRLPVSAQMGVSQDRESPAKSLSELGFLPVFNTGNLKYILYLK